MDSGDNPYEAPASAIVDAQADPARRLFRTTGIYLATFLGSMFAGGWLLAKNHEAMGESGLARKVRWGGAIGTVAIVGLSLLLPEQIPGVAYLVPQFVAVNYWLKKTAQGDAIAARIAAGSPMRSNWAAAGIGLLCGISTLAVVMLIVFAASFGFDVQL